MKIEKLETSSELTLTVSGYLDTATAPELEATLKASIEGKTSLIFDFTDLVYMSSSGIRILIYARKYMADKGTMVVRNVQKSVYDVMEMVGLTDMLTLK